jgi:hypothetical protein
MSWLEPRRPKRQLSGQDWRFLPQLFDRTPFPAPRRKRCEVMGDQGGCDFKRGHSGECSRAYVLPLPDATPSNGFTYAGRAPRPFP